MELIAGRKGFVYTLEAVIAATLFIGIVLVVIPGIQNDRPPRTVQATIHTGLGSLDKTYGLENRTPTEIENALGEFVPPGYDHSVRLAKTNTETRKVTAPATYSLDKSGDHFEVQLWIQSASNLDVKFNGEKLLENYSTSGYQAFEVSTGTGELNFTGTGKAVFDFDAYSYTSGIPDRKNVISVNYLTGETEVQTFLWSE